MKNELYYNISDKEKIMLFDLAAQTAKENNMDYEKAMDSVIQAFLISKEEMNMAPKPDLVPNFGKEPAFDMTPSQEFVQKDPFVFDLPSKPVDDFKSSSDVYGGPSLEQVDTQKIQQDNFVSI